ncbi:hypothetical protein NHX12_008241, partial [Muraenolepis orangiensis]
MCGNDQRKSSRPVRAAVPSGEEESRPAWLTEVTELIGVATLQTRRQPSPGPRQGQGKDFGAGVVSFRDGPVVTMAPTNTPGGPPVRLQAAEVRNTETGASCATSGPLAQETPSLKGSPNCTPTENPPAPSQLPGPQPGGDGACLALKAIGTKNSGHLTASQQEQLWELLREFKDSFALGEEEFGMTHLAQHETIKCRPGRLPL